MFKIHFINSVNSNNTGDMACSPINYYMDIFQNYNCIRHDRNYIQRTQISKNDLVIIGGGGMLYCTDRGNESINQLLDISDNVIAWAVGFNTHSNRPVGVEIDFARFRLIGLRDYGHPLCTSYLPCVSAMAKELDTKADIKRHIGIIEHLSYPITDFSYEKITNQRSFQDIANFIASSEIIVANSYHAVYWATLMGKKVICINKFNNEFSSNRFEHLKYPPINYSGCLELDISKASVYNNALDESRQLNEQFLESIKQLLPPKTNNQYQKMYDMTRYATIERSIGVYKENLSKIERSIGVYKEHLSKIERLLDVYKENLSKTEQRLTIVENKQKYPAFLIHFICLFIPNKKVRKYLRANYARAKVV